MSKNIKDNNDKNSHLNYKVINVTALMIFLYVAVANINIWWGIFVKCAHLLAPFIVAFAFAYAFTPMVRWFQEKGLKKGLAVIVVLLILLSIVVGLIALVVPLLYDQLKLLIKMVIEVLENFNTKFDVNIGSFEIKVTDYLNTALKDLGTIASSTTMGILSKSLDFTGKFIVGFVGFIYFLADMDKIRGGIKEILLPISKRSVEYIKCMDVEITNYLKGLEIFMVVQFFEYSLLFFLVGHPNWLILGLLACFTTVIPYFGGLITNIIAIILASVVSFKLVVMTTIICIIFPQLDGYVISPKIYGKTTNVNPLITIMAVSVGGTLAGVKGIVLALPTYLLIRTTYNFFKKDLKKGMTLVKENI